MAATNPTLSELAGDLSDALGAKVTRNDILRAAARLSIPVRDGRIFEGYVGSLYVAIKATVSDRASMREIIEDHFTFEAATRR